MPGLRTKVHSPILPILTLKLVAMAMSIEPLEKEEDWSYTIEYLPYGDNLVKICPVDREITLLKRLFFKNKRTKLVQAERVARGTCIPRGRNNCEKVETGGSMRCNTLSELCITLLNMF